MGMILRVNFQDGGLRKPVARLLYTAGLFEGFSENLKNCLVNVN